MRLYYHPESDALFWSDEYPQDGLCEDVSGYQRFREAARERGIDEPFTAIGYSASADPDVISGARPHPLTGYEAAAALTVRGCGTVWKDSDKKIIPDEDVARVLAPLTGGMAGAIQKSYKAWERKPSDFYPTPVDVTESLMPVIGQMISDGGKIWEPCCGDMHMSRVLEYHGYEVTSTDLRDTGQGIGGIDFLNDDVTETLGWFPDPDMIVMNPPFSLAADFILKALSYTPRVACLMKIDYWNALGRQPLWKANMPKLFLPLTWRPAFLQKERGNSPLMNCAWCVWNDSDENFCAIEPLPKRVYPGYREDGIRTAFAKLGQAVDDLTLAIVGSNFRDA